MSRIAIPVSICPVAPDFPGAAPIGIDVNLFAAAHKVALIFLAPRAGTLHSFEFSQVANGVAPGNGLRISWQALDASGDPDGVVTYWRDITSGFGAAVWHVPPGPITDDGTNTGNKLTVTCGQYLAAVVGFRATFTTGNITIGGTSMGANHMGLAHYRDAFAAAWARSGASIPRFGIRYDDGYVELVPGAYPIKAFNTTTYNSGSTPDERGMRFSYPSNVYINGMWARIDLDGPADVVLYDTDGTTPLATTSLLSAVRDQTGGGTIFVPLTETRLTANGVYRVTVKPTSATSLSIYDVDINAVTQLAFMPGGATWYYTSRTDAGAWSDTSTKRPWFGLSLSAVDSIPLGAEVSHVAVS